jgi:lysophospholipase L1-like esterase
MRRFLSMGLLLALALTPPVATSQVVGNMPGVAAGGYGYPKRPLPALPLATGAKVVGLGHSFLGRGSYSRYLASQTATNGLQGSDETALGYLYYIKAVDGRFNLDLFADGAVPWSPPSSGRAVTGSQHGLSGDHLLYGGASLPGTIARSPYALARQPQIAVLDIGTNDISSGLLGRGDNDAPSIIGQLDRQIGLLTDAGVWVVVKTVAWRFDWPAGDSRLATITAVNDWILAQSARAGVKVWDTTMIDGTASTSHGSGVTDRIGADGVHPTAYGAGVLANSLLPILKDMVTAGEARNLDPLSANLFPYPGLPGVGGTIGAGVTGTVATGMAVTRSAGSSTAVASKEVIGAGNEKQVLTITPVDDGTALHQFRFTASADINFSTLGVSEGEWLEVTVPVELGDWDGWSWNSSNTNGGPATLVNEQYNANALIWETNIVTGNGWGGKTLLLDAKIPVQAAAGATKLRWSSRPIQIQFRSSATGTGVVKIGSPIMRKISDPRTGWRLP